jgi:hypothetical protein
MGLEPDASGAVRMRMELGVRIVRTAFINTNTSDLSGRRGDRNHVSRRCEGIRSHMVRHLPSVISMDSAYNLLPR